MLFKYKAINPDGSRTEGKIEGSNEDDAIGVLQDKQLIIVSLEPYEEKNLFGSPTTGFKIPGFGPKVEEKDKETDKSDVVLIDETIVETEA